MKVDLEELKRLHEESYKSGSKYLECAGQLMRDFPAILAKLEAAESDVVRLHKENMEYYDALMEFRNSTLTRKLEAAQRLRRAIAAVEADQNEETEQEYIDALEAFDKEPE